MTHLGGTSFCFFAYFGWYLSWYLSATSCIDTPDETLRLNQPGDQALRPPKA